MRLVKESQPGDRGTLLSALSSRIALKDSSLARSTSVHVGLGQTCTGHLRQHLLVAEVKNRMHRKHIKKEIKCGCEVCTHYFLQRDF